ncbi:MAG: hypothetical protein ACP5NA_05570 [Candidatus Acidulodesulfobacterium sp.]
MNLLKLKIADNIIILNNYIILILSEKRENPINLKKIFERKVLLTKLFFKSDRRCKNFDAGRFKSVKEDDYKLYLQNKLSYIAESDRKIIDMLKGMKENVGEKIAMLNKISFAIKAYKSN